MPNESDSEQQFTGNIAFRKLCGVAIFHLPEKALRRNPVQAVPVIEAAEPVDVIHPVDEDMIDFSGQCRGELGRISGEYGPDESHRPDAGLVKAPQGGDSFGDRRSPRFEKPGHPPVVGRDRESDLEVAELPEEIQIPQGQNGFGLNADRPSGLEQGFETAPGQSIFRLERLITVADRRYPDLSALSVAELAPEDVRGIDLDVDERPPRLGVARVTGDEQTSITISASDLAARVSVDAVIVNLGFVEDGLRLDFPDDQA